MADLDPMTIGLMLVVVVFAIIGFFEMTFLRKKIKNRRIRSPKGDTELSDSAHNAIATTKAIVESLGHQGLRSPESNGWIKEAETAFERRNYRVVLELTGKARERLLALKSAQARKGDLVKLDQLTPVGGTEEVTTKELLQKELAPNLLQSKFSIELAGTAVDQGRAAGRDVIQAIEFLDAARGRFDVKDYDGALSMARLSKRAADGQKIDAPAPAPRAVPVVAAPSAAAAEPCPSCGAMLAEDDAFCRKCGTRLVASACGSCGAELLADDAFCPKCGARVSP
ncbi:MAG: zinc ribbon domain-containing protein [Thermoplasmata archaeon]